MVRTYEETSKKILAFIKKNPEFTINKISFETNIDYRTTWRHIHDLERNKKIRIKEIAGAKIITLVDNDERKG